MSESDRLASSAWSSAVNVPAASRRASTAWDVSVVVPVGGAAPAWDRCADGLRHLDPAPREIVVVLDGPNEVAQARAEAIGARVIVLEERRGPAAARNAGARAASGDLLLFVDADVAVPPDLAARVASLLAERPRVTAVMGSYDDAPGEPAFLSQYRNLLHHYVHQHGRERASTFWAGCGAIRRAAFLDAGGFDERYAEPSIEDIELGARLVQAGHEIHLVPSLQVKHLKRWRLQDMVATDLWRRAVPWTGLMLRQGRAVNDLNVKGRDRVSVVLASIAAACLALTAAWGAWAVLGSVASIALVVHLNRDLFGFFRRHRDILFAARAVPVYWLYLLICGAGVGIAVLRRVLLRRD